MVLAATGQFPRQVRVEFDPAPVATVGNDLDTIAYIAPFAGTLQGVNFVPVSTVTGAATNNRTVSLINLGTGAGTTVMATLNFAAAVNATADVAKVIPLSAVAGALDFAQGDVLVWRSTHVGTGIADPGGIVDLTVTSV